MCLGGGRKLPMTGALCSGLGITPNRSTPSAWYVEQWHPARPPPPCELRVTGTGETRASWVAPRGTRAGVSAPPCITVRTSPFLQPAFLSRYCFLFSFSTIKVKWSHFILFQNNNKKKRLKKRFLHTDNKCPGFIKTWLRTWEMTWISTQILIRIPTIHFQVVMPLRLSFLEDRDGFSHEIQPSLWVSLAGLWSPS